MKIMASCPITSWKIDGENHGNSDSLFSWAPESLQVVTAAMKLKLVCSLEEKLWPTWQHVKKQRHYFADKGPSSQGYGFSSNHVWMWELDHKEGWVLKNWCFWTVVLEKTLESPLDCKEIQPVHPKGSQSWIGRTDAEAEAPILWPSNVKSWLIRKDPDAGKDWRQEKGTTEDRMVEWHHRLNGHEFGQALGDGEGQGSLVCCNPWDCKDSDTAEWLKPTIQQSHSWAYIQTRVSEWGCSVVSNSLQPRGLKPTRLLHPWYFPDKSAGVGCHFLLQEIFPDSGIEPRSPAL